MLCCSWTILFGPVQQSKWESTTLYLSAAECGPAWWWMTPDPLFGFTCSHTCTSCLLNIRSALNKELVRPSIWWSHSPELYYQDKWTSPICVSNWSQNTVSIIYYFLVLSLHEFIYQFTQTVTLLWISTTNICDIDDLQIVYFQVYNRLFHHCTVDSHLLSSYITFPMSKYKIIQNNLVWTMKSSLTCLNARRLPLYLAVCPVNFKKDSHGWYICFLSVWLFFLKITSVHNQRQKQNHVVYHTYKNLIWSSCCKTCINSQSRITQDCNTVIFSTTSINRNTLWFQMFGKISLRNLKVIHCQSLKGELRCQN